MKVLVTGLYLSRNLGGPAMGLTLVNELKKRIENIDFTFAVSATDYEQEKIWADRYKLKIIKQDTITTYILNKSYLRDAYQFLTGKSKLVQYKNQETRSFWLKIHDQYMMVYQEADIVIDMMGTSYIGDGVKEFTEGLSSYSSFYYAKKHNKPFARFIQSFGPFDDWKVRIFAKNEFKSLPFIPARGKNSAAFCRSIVSDKTKVYDFPDSAILLPEDKEYAEKYLTVHGLEKKQYIVVSPSAIIKNSLKKSTSGSIGSKHIESFVLFCTKLLDEGEKIIFVPHMYSNVAYHCDREVSREVLELLNSSNCFIVEEDINPMEAKGLIASSKYAIVSRYHALVAAASTGTPVITIGWNIKYFDFMEYYNIEDMSIDIRLYEPEELSQRVLKLIDTVTTQEYDNCFECLHPKMVKKVNLAFDVLANWIRVPQP